MKGSVIAIIYALCANIGIAVAKFIAAFITGSGSMLAEGIHSLVDSCNQVLLLIGMKVAKKPANEEHPLGYGKAVYFWSFIVAIMLFSMGGVFSIYEGINKLRVGHTVENLWVAFIVLVLSIILEIFSLIGAFRIVKQYKKGLSLFSWFRGSKQSELMVVIGEDIAAVLGLGIVFISIILTLTTGNNFYDALGSICIGVLLVIIAVSIGKEVGGLLIGESAEADMQKRIFLFFSSEKSLVDEVLHLITFQLGSEIMVAVKIKPVKNISVGELIELINESEKKLKAKYPEIKWIFVEPDYTD